MYSIKLNNIKKIFDKTKIALNFESMQFQQNEVTTLLGPNGSGKTTTFKLILGVLDQTAGNIKFYKNNLECIRPKIGFFFEDFNPLENLTVKQYLKARAIFLDIKDKNKEINRIIQILDLDGDKKNGTLSSGQKKKLALGTSLMGNPEIFIFDEPFNSLDPIMKGYFIKIIKYLRDEKGKTIIISSHDLIGVSEVSDVVYFIKQGGILLKEDISDKYNYDFLKQRYEEFYSLDNDDRLKLI